MVQIGSQHDFLKHSQVVEIWYKLAHKMIEAI